MKKLTKKFEVNFEPITPEILAKIKLQAETIGLGKFVGFAFYEGGKLIHSSWKYKPPVGLN